MNRILLLGVMAATLSACAQTTTTPQANPQLKRAYSQCMVKAEGNPDKVEACQSVLEVLKENQQHRAFADKESVRVFDYQNCIQAAKTGVGENYQQACAKIWQEIRNSNH